MNKIPGGLSNVPGFSFSAVKCGIRYEDRYDYSIIIADTDCNGAGVFTTNRVCAAPVKLSRSRIEGPLKAILINATNANACTGRQGLETAEKLTGDIAEKLSIDPASVIMASTGIIGRQLPFEKMKDCHSTLLEEKSPGKGSLVAEAIMTTDTFPKEVCASFDTSKGLFFIAGIAKGSGMIAPDMATLLSFIITDAPVNAGDLDILFKRTIKKTLNALTIDGDTSTNDTAVILSPRSKTPLSQEDDLASFEEALIYILSELSRMLVTDGEGTTKIVTIAVENALSDSDAEKIARSVSESLLVKTAIFGNDPNWGRIACAAGYSGADLDEEQLSIIIEDKPLFHKGTPCEIDNNAILDIMKKESYTITIDIGLGKHDFSMLTCDLSYEYVKINAEYST